MELVVINVVHVLSINKPRVAFLALQNTSPSNGNYANRICSWSIVCALLAGCLVVNGRNHGVPPTRQVDVFATGVCLSLLPSV